MEGKRTSVKCFGYIKRSGAFIYKKILKRKWKASEQGVENDTSGKLTPRERRTAVYWSCYTGLQYNYYTELLKQHIPFSRTGRSFLSFVNFQAPDINKVWSGEQHALCRVYSDLSYLRHLARHIKLQQACAVIDIICICLGQSTLSKFLQTSPCFSSNPGLQRHVVFNRSLLSTSPRTLPPAFLQPPHKGVLKETQEGVGVAL